MKKFLSLFCVLAIIAAFAVIPASAVEAAQTIVDVEPGDEVVYELVLSDVDEKVVGCDFSVYYDADAFKVTGVADYSGSYNEDDWRATINPDIPGEVVGNWSILRGLDFSDGGDIVKVKLEAKEATSTHISYYVRYLYPDSLQEFTKYTFTCNVTKNGSTVLQNAKPELGKNTNSDPGQFVNSVDGDSANAGQGAAVSSGGSDGSNGDPAENQGGNNTSSGTSSAPSDSSKTNPTNSNSPSSKIARVETVVSTDAQGNEIITVVSATPSEAGGGSSPALWIVLGVIVLGGAAVVIYFVMNKKKNPDGSASGNSDTDKK